MTLRLSLPTGLPMTRSTWARSTIGPSTGYGRGLGHRVPAPIERREALDELGDPLDGLAPQVGLVAGDERRRRSRRCCAPRRPGGPGPRRRASAGVGSPRQFSSSWIALWATWPLARAGVQVKSSGVEVVRLARQHLAMACLVTNSSSSPRRAASSARPSVTSRAARRRTPGRTRPAGRCGAATSSVRCWTGVSRRRSVTPATVPRGCRQRTRDSDGAHPLVILRPMESSTTVQFAHAARTLAAEARRRGLSGRASGARRG